MDGPDSWGEETFVDPSAEYDLIQAFFNLCTYFPPPLDPSLLDSVDFWSLLFFLFRAEITTEFSTVVMVDGSDSARTLGLL